MSKNIGSTLLLKNIPIGTFVHNIELKPNQGGKFIRSAGTFGQIIQIQKKLCENTFIF